MVKLLLAYSNLNKVKSGEEIYSQELKKTFKDLKIFDYESRVKNKTKFSLLKEPIAAYKLNKQLEKKINEIKPEIIFTNGIFGWALNRKKIDCPIVNICHGTYAALSRNAMKKNLN